MNLLNDIAEICKDDKEHNIYVNVDTSSITVELEYDPNHEYDSKEAIPIKYDLCGEFAYIPQDELIDQYRPDDYGIDLAEIRLIQRIMEYLEEHRDGIEFLCNSYDAAYRDGHNTLSC